MEQKSLRGMYEKERQRPTPSQLFVEKVASTCGVTETTVRAWLSGTARPGKAVRLLLEREFGTPWQVLFPGLAENKEQF